MAVSLYTNVSDGGGSSKKKTTTTTTSNQKPTSAMTSREKAANYEAQKAAASGASSQQQAAIYRAIAGPTANPTSYTPNAKDGTYSAVNNNASALAARAAAQNGNAAAQNYLDNFTKATNSAPEIYVQTLKNTPQTNNTSAPSQQVVDPNSAARALALASSNSSNRTNQALAKTSVNNAVEQIKKIAQNSVAKQEQVKKRQDQIKRGEELAKQAEDARRAGIQRSVELQTGSKNGKRKKDDDKNAVNLNNVPRNIQTPEQYQAWLASQNIVDPALLGVENYPLNVNDIPRNSNMEKAPLNTGTGSVQDWLAKLVGGAVWNTQTPIPKDATQNDLARVVGNLVWNSANPGSDTPTASALAKEAEDARAKGIAENVAAFERLRNNPELMGTPTVTPNAGDTPYIPPAVGGDLGGGLGPYLVNGGTVSAYNDFWNPAYDYLNLQFPSGWDYDSIANQYYNAANDYVNNLDVYSKALLGQVGDQSFSTIKDYMDTVRRNHASGNTSGASIGAMLSSDLQAMNSLAGAENAQQNEVYNNVLNMMSQAIKLRDYDSKQDTYSTVNAIQTPLMNAYGSNQQQAAGDALAAAAARYAANLDYNAQMNANSIQNDYNTKLLAQNASQPQYGAYQDLVNLVGLDAARKYIQSQM